MSGEELETIYITACPTCGGLAQAIKEGAGIVYRQVIAYIRSEVFNALDVAMENGFDQRGLLDNDIAADLVKNNPDLEGCDPLELLPHIWEWKQDRARKDGRASPMPQLTEDERQLLLLGIAELALERPGFDYALGELAKRFAGFTMYRDFKRVNADRVKDCRGPLGFPGGDMRG